MPGKHFEKSILPRFKAALSSAMPGNEEGIGVGEDKLVVKGKFSKILQKEL